jgi:hypothetical protein
MFRYYFAMALLRDGDVRQMELAIRDKHGSTDPAILTRWVAQLLADRQARTAVIQRLARQAHHVRGRLAQAARYFDGLIDEMERTSREPWPGKLPCPTCGASAEQVRAEFRPDDARGHVLVHQHADGTVCEPKPASS